MLWESRCIHCGECLNVCPQGAIRKDCDTGCLVTDRELCTLCETCLNVCAAQARERVGREVTTADVMREIERDTAFYDESGGGVTFSGGEPLWQPVFLLSLLKSCKAYEIHTALDTSGLAAWETIESVLPYVDLFLYDLKMVDEARHKQVTGVSNRLILQNLERLARLGCRIILRVPVIPRVNDDEANWAELCALTARLPRIERVDLLPYHHAAAGKYDRLGRAYRLPDTQPPSAEHLDTLAQPLRECGLNHGFSVKIGG